MNRIHKSIFNEQTGTYVAVSENTKNKGKKGNKVLAATALSAALGFGAMGSAQAQLVDACTGIGLPKSAVTDIVGQVVSPLVTTLEGVPLLGPVLSLLGLGDILDAAASGAPLQVGVIGTDAEGNPAVLYNAECNLTADSLNLTDPAGIAIGGNTITGLGSDAAGAAAVSSAADFTSIAFGNYSEATQSKAIAFGEAAKAFGEGSVAVGANALSSNLNATALGTGAQATGEGSTALGAGAQANATNSVALGNGSVATVANTVSVGSVGNERKITNVADGTVAAGSTDAINGGQLHQLAISTGLGLVQQADNLAPITVGKDSAGTVVDFTNIAAQTRKLTGVADGELSPTSTDAVTGNQLFNTNTNLDSTLAALGGGAQVDPVSGTVTAPSYVLDDGTNTGVTTSFDNVGGALGNLDGRVTSNTGRITNIEGDITDITNDLGDLTANAVTYTDATKTAINLAGAGGTTISNLKDGKVSASSTEAINGAQLYRSTSDLAAALGGNAKVDADGTLQAPEYELTYGTPGLTAGKHDNVGSVLGELAGHVGSNAVNIANNTTNITKLLDGEVGIVKQDAATRDITVGSETDGTVVDIAGTDGVRTLTGLKDGALSGASTDAVTGAQLFTTNTNLGKTLDVLGASIDPITGEFKDPEYKLDSDKTTEKTVGGALSNLDGRVTANTGLITNITGDIQSIINGETGIVKYDSATSTITVGSDGPAAGATTVNFAGKDATTGDAVNRKLTGIANGNVVENGNEAVTGGQLFTTNKAIESALGGEDASGNTALKTGTGVLDADGNLISPTYTLTAIDDKGGAADVDTTGVGGALYSLNTSMGNVNSIVNNLQTQLNSGTIGLVQQDVVTRNITVGANTDGTIVNFAGKDGTTGDAINRTLSGVAAGTATTDAVNVSQLNAAVGLLGGGAKVNDDGTVTTPTYQLDDGNGNKVDVVGVEGAFKQLDGRVADNTSAITRIDGDINTINENITQIQQGGAGIVKYDQASETITVGSEVVATSVDFAGKDATGAVVDRKLTGVAAGTASNHAVNRQQLDRVAAALGGAKDANGNPTGVFNDEGDFTNPLYELNNVTNNGVSTTEKTKVTGVGSALTHLNDSVVSLQNQVNSSIGLIQQPGTGDQTISIGGNTGGTVINIAGTDGDRQITGVAAGTAPNHAVNKQQLDNTAAALRGDIRRAEKRSEAGIAAATAVATLGQAYQPGQSAFSMGGGTWRGETGYAMGVSTVSENGKWLLKGAVSGSGRGGAGGGASVTYLW